MKLDKCSIFTSANLNRERANPTQKSISPLIINRWWNVVRASQIRIILGVGRRISLVRQTLVFAHLYLIGRDTLRLQMQRCFYKGRKEAGDKVPVYVTVECPDTCKFSVND